MKTKILYITSLLLIIGCSKPVEESTLIYKDGLMYLPDSDLPYSGEVVLYYKNGEKVYQGTYENGLLVKYSYLNKDGTVKEPLNYETSLVEREGVYYTNDTNEPYTGPVFSLYGDGKISYEGYLKHGKPDGLFTIWYENGQKEVEGTYKDGELDGTVNDWYDNGQKREKVTFETGKQNGIWEMWYENGELIISGSFINDLGNGLFKTDSDTVDFTGRNFDINRISNFFGIRDSRFSKSN